MKFPPYPLYKPTGVEWFDSVPEDWAPIPLRRISVRYSGGTPDRQNDSYWEDGTVPWINSGAVNQGLITKPSAFITEEAYRNSSAKWIAKGDLVMALAGQGRTKGMVAQTGIPTTCNQSMAAICPNKSTNPRYLYWLLVSQYQEIRNMAGGEQRDGLNLEILGSIPCLKPPEAEQKAITAFLDRETGRIDTLIAKKRELIESLNEKRTALISRTVTRGLNPDVKLKPSGIECLGDIPQHWTVKKLSYLALLKSGASITSEEFDDKGSYPVFGGNGLRGYSTTFTHNGDRVLIGRQGALCGNINYATGKFFASEHAVVVTPLAEFATTWMGELLRIMNLNQYSVSAAQPGLSVSTINALKIPVPPLPEQLLIVNFLVNETGKIDRMTEKTEKAIDKLQEYRTALITAAVSGKIDVRGSVGVHRVE
jgi:type I restriction enzyme S subunit